MNREPLKVTCPICGGSGKKQSFDFSAMSAVVPVKCSYCNGTGRVSAPESETKKAESEE